MATILGVIGGAALYVVRGEVRRDVQGMRGEVRRDVQRLDGRIDTHEKGCEQRQKALDERHETANRELTEIKSAVQRMDSKIDRLLEHR